MWKIGEINCKRTTYVPVLIFVEVGVSEKGILTLVHMFITRLVPVSMWPPTCLVLFTVWHIHAGCQHMLQVWMKFGTSITLKLSSCIRIYFIFTINQCDVTLHLNDYRNILLYTSTFHKNYLELNYTNVAKCLSSFRKKGRKSV